MSDVVRKLSRPSVFLFSEFLIIVLGVLVALAVDNWNSNRMDLATERDYVERLAEEIKADILYY